MSVPCPLPDLHTLAQPIITILFTVRRRRRESPTASAATPGPCRDGRVCVCVNVGGCDETGRGDVTLRSSSSACDNVGLQLRVRITQRQQTSSRASK